LLFFHVGAQNNQISPFEPNGSVEAPPGVGLDRQGHAPTRDSRLAEEFPFAGKTKTMQSLTINFTRVFFFF
jgi:hypothetical protein